MKGLNNQQKKERTKLIKIQAEYLEKYKEIHGCSRCGLKSKNTYVFDFHHKYDKSFEVSRARVTFVGLDGLIKEMGKCELLCAVCHRIVHKEQKVFRNGSKTN